MMSFLSPGSKINSQGMIWDRWKKLYPEKFPAAEEIFARIHPGARIFIGTACGEPQALTRALVDYVQTHPGALFDAELIQVWTQGKTPYAEGKFPESFRLNSFFVGESTRAAVNSAQADYTPIFLSNVPDLIYKAMMPIDLAIVQTSLPDEEGNVSLGISVDIVRAVVDKATLVAAQANSRMPFVSGDGIINLLDLDFIVPWDQPLLEYVNAAPGEIAARIGAHVARIVQDGSTLQVGYGSIPDAVLSLLKDKKHLGLHSELFTDGVAELMQIGVLDNSQKSIDVGVAVASFSMGRKETYDFLHRNPAVELRSIDYTNNPLVIARQRNMIAINSALELDLTGQATAESLNHAIYSGVGGQADFMRSAVLAPGGKSILALPATAAGGSVSRIVPALPAGAAVTLHRGDVRYVVTEYGIAYLHGKNIRERAMDLISIAHPSFRSGLVEEARKLGLIYKDQAYVPGVYPDGLEAFRRSRTGLDIFLRPVKISDEPLLKELFYSLSDRSMYQRFASARKDMPHARLQEFVAVDYSRSMVILALVSRGEREMAVGLGQYSINQDTLTAELALVVRDEYQHQGIGKEIQSYLTLLARSYGLQGFTAEVLEDNSAALDLLERMGFEMVVQEGGVREMKLLFDKKR